MTLNYYRLPKSPAIMTEEESLSYFDGEPWSVVMRSILMYEVERVRGTRIEHRTMRGLWYSLVKPSLDRLGALEKEYFTLDRVSKPADVGKVPRWDGILSKYLAELVENGITSYEELRIVDGSRQRYPPRAQSLTTQRIEVLGVHRPDILIFTEKDTIFREIAAIASVYGISVLSGSGKPGYAATENLIREMARHPKFISGMPITVLTLTDYDPSGYIISESLIDQVLRVVSVLPQVSKVRYLRLGLEPSQLTDAELLANIYTPAKAGLDKWFEKTGGVNGQPVGLELDSLPLSRIRRLFVEGIEAVIKNKSGYEENLAKSFVEQIIWDSLKDKFEALREKAWGDVDGDELAASLNLKSDGLANIAARGDSYVDPWADALHLFGEVGHIIDEIKDILGRD